MSDGTNQALLLSTINVWTPILSVLIGTSPKEIACDPAAIDDSRAAVDARIDG